MSITVSKFGGTSLATKENFERAKAIILSDPKRSIIVVSAPGKRFKDDAKITDLLENVASRYLELGQDVRDEVVMLGEYFMAKAMANAIGFEFVDIQKTGIISFDTNGDVDLDESKKNFEKFKGKRVVVPGFYGRMPCGAVKTFSRGGGDITGAIMANIADADLYENWTDVGGFYSSDPNKSMDAMNIPFLSYEQALVLCNSGANVLHPSCIPFAKEKGIPIRVLNTFDPKSRGTTVGAKTEYKKLTEPVVV
ncbi:MAG: hypothetical protein FWE03_05270 [Firmicutes bacterium]|nr:hypothetical protein [Bacillota bacterium]